MSHAGLYEREAGSDDDGSCEDPHGPSAFLPPRPGGRGRPSLNGRALRGPALPGSFHVRDCVELADSVCGNTWVLRKSRRTSLACRLACRAGRAAEPCLAQHPQGQWMATPAAWSLLCARAAWWVCLDKQGLVLCCLDIEGLLCWLCSVAYPWLYEGMT